MGTRERLCEQAGDETLLFLDNHDNAILGLATRFGFDGAVVAYDLDKVMANLRKDLGSRLAAQEWFEFNMIGAWVGEKTPVFVEKKEWSNL